MAKTSKPRNELPEETKLYAAIGRGISRWSNIETALLYIFAASTGMSIKTSAILFRHTKTFTLMLDFVDSATKEAMPHSKLVIYWNSVVEYLRELAGDRNFLAHVPVAIHIKDKAECLMGTTSVEYYAGFDIEDVKRGLVGLNEVHQLVLDFNFAFDTLLDFQRQFLLHGPLTEKYYASVVRRRPTRKQRLEDACRSPQRRLQP